MKTMMNFNDFDVHVNDSLDTTRTLRFRFVPSKVWLLVLWSEECSSKKSCRERSTVQAPESLEFGVRSRPDI